MVGMKTCVLSAPPGPELPTPGLEQQTQLFPLSVSLSVNLRVVFSHRGLSSGHKMDLPGLEVPDTMSSLSIVGAIVWPLCLAFAAASTSFYCNLGAVKLEGEEKLFGGLWNPHTSVLYLYIGLEKFVDCS